MNWDALAEGSPGAWENDIFQTRDKSKSQFMSELAKSRDVSVEQIVDFKIE